MATKRIDSNARVKYIIVPGEVRSRTDGDTHYISARQLIKLYGVKPEECLIAKEEKLSLERLASSDVVFLFPRADGDYEKIKKRLILADDIEAIAQNVKKEFDEYAALAGQIPDYVSEFMVDEISVLFEILVKRLELISRNLRS